MPQLPFGRTYDVYDGDASYASYGDASWVSYDVQDQVGCFLQG